MRDETQEFVPTPKALGASKGGPLLLRVTYTAYPKIHGVGFFYFLTLCG